MNTETNINTTKTQEEYLNKFSEEVKDAMKHEFEENNFKDRLLEERNELGVKIYKLGKFIDNPENKLSCREWDMLKRQLNAMKDYMSAIESRCLYYNIY